MGKNARFAQFAVVWALLIFGLSSIPGAAFPPSKLFSYDKLLHAGVYSVLGGLCFLALRKRSSRPSSVLVLVACALGTLYGMSDELHQMFVPGRSPDWRDVLADSMGGLAGALAAAVLPFAKASAAADKVDRPVAKSGSAS